MAPTVAVNSVLWAGILLGPAGWAFNLQTSYALAGFACDGRWPLVLHGVTLVSLAIAGAGVWLAWGSRRALERAGGAAPEGGRSRADRGLFMAWSGIVLSAFFALAILALWVPTFFIEPCRY